MESPNLSYWQNGGLCKTLNRVFYPGPDHFHRTNKVLCPIKIRYEVWITHVSFNPVCHMLYSTVLATSGTNYSAALSLNPS